ncbi:MAG: hypothetical protein IKT23_04750, partial [Clostridia bacterium]|nr:hypothetical protein [Clostridia bacterium]
MIRKLSVKLILCALLSLLLAGGTFVLIRFGGMRIIDKNIYSQETILSQEKDLFRDFVAYANKNAAGDLTDSENIQGFFVGKQDIIIAVYNAGQ